MRDTGREALAEFLGTFVLIVLGAGVVAQNVLSRGENGSYLAINIGWGIAVTLGCYVAGGVSGAHFNPAVTLALAVHRGFPWRKVPAYVVGQVAGAFSGAAVAFITYREAFDAFDGGVRQVSGPQATAGIFATYPQPFLSLTGGFVDQVVGTALLLAVVFALGDNRNQTPGARHRARDRGPARGRHRHELRLQRGLCHQPRARLRPASLHLARGLGQPGVDRGQRLVVGAAHRTAPRRRPGRIPLRRMRRQATPGKVGS